MEGNRDKGVFVGGLCLEEFRLMLSSWENNFCGLSKNGNCYRDTLRNIILLESWR